MDSEKRQLHIFFFPFVAHGHMIPMVDMARLFASRGVRATILTTPVNASLISRTIQRDKISGIPIQIRTIKFPTAEFGLPQGCENFDLIPSPAMLPNFINATILLQEPLEQLLLQDHPDCLIAGTFFPWATDSAAKFGIPRIVFHGFGFFPLCAMACMRIYEPYKKVSSETEPFVIPNLPGEITLTRMLLPDYVKNDEETYFTKIMKAMKESEERSFGVVVNSFFELEQAYADYYRKVLGRKAWSIGPVSLCNRENPEKAHRGKEVSIDEQECLKWLESKKPNSVVYVCFGSRADFNEWQLREIAHGLEASGQQFIWVVKRSKNKDEDLPEGFEKRMKGRGLIISGWAPQVLILDHEAVGGFVTHCGWNSTLEGVCGGVNMVTWPLSADQFYNEKLVTQVLKIGVAVGAEKWAMIVGDSVSRNKVEKAVKRIMVGEEAEEMRNRVKGLAHMAKTAVEEGGSSYSEFNALLEDLGCPLH